MHALLVICFQVIKVQNTGHQSTQVYKKRSLWFKQSGRVAWLAQDGPTWANLPWFTIRIVGSIGPCIRIFHWTGHWRWRQRLFAPSFLNYRVLVWHSWSGSWRWAWTTRTGAWAWTWRAGFRSRTIGAGVFWRFSHSLKKFGIMLDRVDVISVFLTLLLP